MTDEIFGLNTNADDAARLMIRFIRNDWIELEPALYTGKWFDYRFMNPVQATYLYAHHFVKFYRMAFSRNIDSERGNHVRILKDEDLFKNKRQLISGIWRGRQVADALGMPYDVYLELAFHWTLRYWKQAHLPRPTHLYSDLVTDRAAIAWEERQSAKLYYSHAPQYHNYSYDRLISQMSEGDFEGKTLNSQNAHHEWLFEQVSKHGNDPAIFARLIFDEQVLPESKVYHRLGEEAFERILSYTDRNPAQQHYN